MNILKMFLESVGSTASLCYMMQLDSTSESKCQDIIKECHIGGDKTKKGEFHVTVRYMKSNLGSDLISGYLDGVTLPKITVRGYGFDLFGKDKDVLVMKVKSKELSDWYKQFNEYVVSKGYPKNEFGEYKGHITLSENVKEKPEWDSKYEFDIHFNRHHLMSDKKEVWFKKI